MERKQFSIDPYIDQGGILGAQLEVNEKAASSVMRRTALRRDVFVLRILQDRAQNLDYSENRPYVIGVDDEEIYEKVDNLMKAEYRANQDKSGRNVFGQRFASEMSREVSKKLRGAFLNEKKYILTNSLSIATPNFLLMSVGSGSAVGAAILTFTQDTEAGAGLFRSTEQAALSGVAIAISGFLLFRAGLAIDEFVPLDVDRLLKFREHFLPNLQVPSVLIGSVSLSLNSNKLIRLKS